MANFGVIRNIYKWQEKSLAQIGLDVKTPHIDPETKEVTLASITRHEIYNTLRAIKYPKDIAISHQARKRRSNIRKALWAVPQQSSFPRDITYQAAMNDYLHQLDQARKLQYTASEYWEIWRSHENFVSLMANGISHHARADKSSKYAEYTNLIPKEFVGTIQRALNKLSEYDKMHVKKVLCYKSECIEAYNTKGELIASMPYADMKVNSSLLKSEEKLDKKQKLYTSYQTKKNEKYTKVLPFIEDQDEVTYFNQPWLEVYSSLTKIKPVSKDIYEEMARLMPAWDYKWLHLPSEAVYQLYELLGGNLVWSRQSSKLNWTWNVWWFWTLDKDDSNYGFLLYVKNGKWFITHNAINTWFPARALYESKDQ